jgi:biopolymer transport protein ExbB
MNLLEMFLKGGFVMWFILACSIIAVAIIVEKFIVLRKAKQNIPAFMVKIRNYLKRKDIAGAVNFCMEEKSPISNIVKKALKKYKHGHQRVVETIETAGRQEISKLEKGLSTLATIAGAAPMLGFLGTVTGMIGAFMKIQELQGSAGPADLAGGIWEALLTTAFGLFVGIPVLAVYNYLLSYIQKIVVNMEMVVTDVLDVLEDAAKGKDIEPSDDYEE